MQVVLYHACAAYWHISVCPMKPWCKTYY